jgi:hypothetical protein
VKYFIISHIIAVIDQNQGSTVHSYFKLPGSHLPSQHHAPGINSVTVTVIQLPVAAKEVLVTKKLKGIINNRITLDKFFMILYFYKVARSSRNV